ncbi:MAG: hypothetical protein SFU25_01315, partial [Candidatus Caenarcaniphilales bacterium]|nr:hypothetical protein [Candidatus Caenarcaniphilales bacterium]
DINDACKANRRIHQDTNILHWILQTVGIKKEDEKLPPILRTSHILATTNSYIKLDDSHDLARFQRMGTPILIECINLNQRIEILTKMIAKEYGVSSVDIPQDMIKWLAYNTLGGSEDRKGEGPNTFTPRTYKSEILKLLTLYFKPTNSADSNKQLLKDINSALTEDKKSLTAGPKLTFRNALESTIGSIVGYVREDSLSNVMSQITKFMGGFGDLGFD